MALGVYGRLEVNLLSLNDFTNILTLIVFKLFFVVRVINIVV